MCSEKASLVTEFLYFIHVPMQCPSVMTSSIQLRWLISVNITVFSQVQLVLSPAGWWDGSIGLWKRQSCESSCKSVMCLFVCMCVCTFTCGSKRPMLGVFNNLSPSYFSRHDLSPNPQLNESVTLALQQPRISSLSELPQCQNHRSHLHLLIWMLEVCPLVLVPGQHFTS